MRDYSTATGDVLTPVALLRPWRCRRCRAFSV